MHHLGKLMIQLQTHPWKILWKCFLQALHFLKTNQSVKWGKHNMTYALIQDAWPFWLSFTFFFYKISTVLFLTLLDIHYFFSHSLPKFFKSCPQHKEAMGTSLITWRFHFKLIIAIVYKNNVIAIRCINAIFNIPLDNVTCNCDVQVSFALGKQTMS